MWFSKLKQDTVKSQIYFMCKSDLEHTFVLDLGMSHAIHFGIVKLTLMSNKKKSTLTYIQGF